MPASGTTLSRLAAACPDAAAAFRRLHGGRDEILTHAVFLRRARLGEAVALRCLLPWARVQYVGLTYMDRPRALRSWDVFPRSALWDAFEAAGLEPPRWARGYDFRVLLPTLPGRPAPVYHVINYSAARLYDLNRPVRHAPAATAADLFRLRMAERYREFRKGSRACRQKSRGR
jgi:hypothetical protein